ncbi:MAG: YeeE/YedE family protein [Betaproteobacteria bacterium]
MHIHWQEFTPWSSLIGGAIIGLSVTILILFKGRIAGISGILGALMQFKNTPKDHYLWRILFLIGLLSSSLIYSLFFTLPNMVIDASFIMLIFAGLLVGFGTRMGSGCTSGHGICGLGRLSPRSLVATLSFMSAGFIACYVFLHIFS